MDRSKSTHQTRGRSLWFAAGLAALLFLTAVPPASANPRVTVGIGIGIGAPYGYPAPYYPPAPVYGYPPPCGGAVVYAPPRRGPRAAWARGHWQWTRDPWGRKVRVWSPPRNQW